MGVAGENHGFVGLGLGNHRFQKLLYQAGDLVNFGTQIHPQVESHLVVPASGGMQLFAHIPQPLGQHLLDEHVDILAAEVKYQLAGIQILQNSLKAVDELLGLPLGDDALSPQHGGMSHGAGDILSVHPAVKVDGGIEIVRNAVGFAGGPSGPHFFHNPVLALLSL